MGGFQIVALGVLSLLIIITVVAAFAERIARRVGLFWSLVWMAAGVAVVWPGSTSLAARALGIGRGADLVLYCFCVLMLVGFFMTYTRLRRLDNAITLLARHLALQDPKMPGAQPPPAGSSEPDSAAGRADDPSR